MRDPPPPRSRRPLWPVAAMVALFVLPSNWGLAVLLAALAARLVRAAVVRHRARLAARALAAGDAGPEGALLLGADDAGRGVVLSDRQLAAHGLILGATGAGKSTTLLALLVPQIRRGRPVVVLDLKGSPAFAAQLSQAAQTSGRRVRIWTLDGPDSWNPLAHGNATELKDKLIVTERFTEPHYRRAAERYAQTAIGVLQELAPGRAIGLNAVVELLDPRRLAAAARMLPDARRDRVTDYLEGLSGDQLSAIRGLASRLAIITESHAGRFLEPGGSGPAGGEPIDMRRALAGEEVVVFSLNSSTYGSLAAQLGTLVVQDIIAASGHRLGAGGEPAAVVGIDEFSALGSDNLMALMARGRESGVSLLLATQEIADLERAARGLKDQVLGNTGVKIAHRQDVPESADMVARLAGRERVWERTYQVRPGPLGTTDLRRGTLRLVDRYVIDPEQVRSLPTGDAVVIVKTPTSSARLTRVLPAARREGPER